MRIPHLRHRNGKGTREALNRIRPCAIRTISGSRLQFHSTTCTFRTARRTRANDRRRDQENPKHISPHILSRTLYPSFDLIRIRIDPKGCAYPIEKCRGRLLRKHGIRNSIWYAARKRPLVLMQWSLSRPGLQRPAATPPCVFKAAW